MPDSSRTFYVMEKKEFAAFSACMVLSVHVLLSVDQSVIPVLPRPSTILKRKVYSPCRVNLTGPFLRLNRGGTHTLTTPGQ